MEESVQNVQAFGLNMELGNVIKMEWRVRRVFDHDGQWEKSPTLHAEMGLLSIY